MKVLKILKKYINAVYVAISTSLAMLTVPTFMLMCIVSKYCGGKFISVSIITAYVPFLFGEKLRYFFYKHSLKKLGKDTVFSFGSYCNYRETVIGNRVLIGYFNCIGRVNIGDDVLLGGYVNILSGRHQHGFSKKGLSMRQQKGEEKSLTEIGSDVWVGSNCVIMNNIGSHCVVAAGAIVVKEVTSDSLVAGNPARIIRNI